MIISTKAATNITTKLIIKTITAIVPVFISFYSINYVALYIIRKAANYKTILNKNKKGLKRNLELLIEINLVNLITNLINNVINIL